MLMIVRQLVWRWNSYTYLWNVMALMSRTIPLTVGWNEEQSERRRGKNMWKYHNLHIYDSFLMIRIVTSSNEESIEPEILLVSKRPIWLSLQCVRPETVPSLVIIGNVERMRIKCAYESNLFKYIIIMTIFLFWVTFNRRYTQKLFHVHALRAYDWYRTYKRLFALISVHINCVIIRILSKWKKS